MAKPLSVFVNIGAKVGSSVGASINSVERNFNRMNRNLRVGIAETQIAMRRLEDGNARRRADLFDAAAMGASLIAATKPALEFEDSLIRLGNVAEVYGPRLQGVGRDAIRTGLDFGVGGRAALGGLNDYLAAGVQLEAAQGALRPTLMLARTANIDNNAAAGAGVAVMQNLRVAVTDLDSAFDRMTAAGKEGKVEIGDMARIFPRVTASAQKLGFEGVEGVGRLASMLQITRQGATDAEQAGNDLYNLFEKMTADETAKAFSKQGVSLEAMWAEAKATGQSYFDMVLNKVSELSRNGEDPFVLNELFGDLQARNALTMLIKNRAEMDRITAATRRAAGVMKSDWERVQKSGASKMRVFKAQLEGIGISLARTIIPIFGAGAEAVGGFLGRVADFAEKYPAITTGLVTLVGGLILFRVAAIAGAWAAGLLNAQWLAMKLHFLMLGGGLIGGVVRGFTLLRNSMASLMLLQAVGGWRAVGGALLGLLNPIGLVRLGMMALRMAVIGTGIGAILVGIALAGMWIANNWKGIGAFFTAFGKAFMEAIGPVRPALEPVIGLFQRGVAWVEKLVGPISIESWTRWGTMAGSAIGGIVRSIVEFITKIGEGINKVRELWSAVREGRFGRPATPPTPAGAEPGRTPVPIAGARARGGPVWGGAPFLVGERGPELFVPPGRGRILTAGATAAAMFAGIAGPASAEVHVSPATEIAQASAPPPRGPRDDRPPHGPEGSGGHALNLGGATFNIYGATDPDAVGREVERVIRRMVSGQTRIYSD